MRLPHLASLFLKSSLQFLIVSNTVIMHHLLYLFSKCPGSYSRPHSSPFCWYKLCIIFLIAVSNIVQKCQKAIFSDLVFKIVYAVPNRSQKYQSVCFREIVFKIVSEDPNNVKMIALEAFFLNFSEGTNRSK